MSRRILAIWLANLAIDRWRRSAGEAADAAPLALIAETAHGPRIAAANAAGAAAGARAGMMVADARALCPTLAVAPSDPPGNRATLESLAVWAQRWGPWSALDLPDGLIVDVTGAAHLFGGEEALLADVHNRISARGFKVRAAIAPTAGAAWALAHHGPAGANLAPQADIERVLAPLPIAALRLDEDVQLVLRRLGLKRIGDLGGVAREALARRFRNRRAPAANPLVRLDQLRGQVPEPLLPVVAHEAPLVQRRLLEPLRHRELLDRVVADLAADIVRALEAQGEGARRLELGLWKVDGEVVVRRLELAAATRDTAHIARLFAGKLDDIDAGFGIELTRLRAPWTEPLALAQVDIEASAEHHGTSLAACIDRLSVRLGPEAVRKPVPYPSHVPERAQRWQALSGTADTSVSALRHRPTPPLDHLSGYTAVGGRAGEWAGAASSREAGQTRPMKLLDRAEPIAVLYATPDGLPRRFRWRGGVHEVARVEGPERIAPEWWRERGSARLRDYYRIEDDRGRRYWIYRLGLAGDGRGGVPEWFLQGLFG